MPDPKNDTDDVKLTTVAELLEDARPVRPTAVDAADKS